MDCTAKLPPLFRIDVGIDSYFSPKEKALIIESFIRWQDASHGLILFHLGNFSINSLIRHDDDSNTWFAMNVIRAMSNDSVIKRAEKELGKNINGLAITGKDASAALLVMDKLPSKKEFIGVTMHEIGHLLGLGHGPLGTIMYQYSNRPTRVTQHDLRKLMMCWEGFLNLAVH